jgi:hypothetical protein
MPDADLAVAAAEAGAAVVRAGFGQPLDRHDALLAPVAKQFRGGRP